MNALVNQEQRAIFRAPVYSFEDMDRMADVLAQSGLFGVKNKTQAMALMLVAQAEGEHPTLDMKARGALLAADNEEPEQDERLTCLHCNGSGEGRVSESRCTSCGGSGVERVISDDSGPDYDELRRQQADVYLSRTKVQRADRRALEIQVREQDCGVVR